MDSELLHSPSRGVEAILNEYYRTIPVEKGGPTAEGELHSATMRAYAHLPAQPLVARPHASNPLLAAVHAGMVGVHIRMSADAARETPGLKPSDIIKMAVATPFRLSCHHRYFAVAMAALPKDTRFFLAADSVEAFTSLASISKLKGRIFTAPDFSCNDRSASCVKTAAANLVLLSRTQRLLPSRWRYASISVPTILF